MYKKMLDYVRETLEANGGEDCSIVSIPFRKRSEHIRRVLMWSERLISGMDQVNKEALLVSAAFHDVGYAVVKDNKQHAQNSTIICRDYLVENGFDDEFIEIVNYLVGNHSNKELIHIKDTPIELIVLMEADLLDETGALSIVWDSMKEGMAQMQSFEKTYEHIRNYTGKIIETNPMVTAKAKQYWEEKQKLVKKFIEHLEYDLGI